MKLSFKKMKLANKTAIVVSIVLAIILIIQSMISISMASNSAQAEIQGQFSSIAQSNGLQVQSIINTGAYAARDLEDYLLDTCKLQEQQNNLIINESVIYGVQISEINAQAEKYVLNSIWNRVKNSEDVIGMGAFYEPYSFDKNIKDYTCYIEKANAENKSVQTFGEYSDYGSEDWYKEFAPNQKAGFTEPYVYNGITIITAVYPIVYKGVTKGVATADISVSNFNKIESSNKDFKTMFARIISSKGTIVYDSRNEKNYNKNITDILSNKEDKQSLQEGLGKTAEFSITTTNEKGIEEVRFFYPIKTGDTIWWAETGLQHSDLNKRVTTLAITMSLMAVIALVLIAIVTVVLIRKMINPIQGVLKAANCIAEGNFDINIEAKSEDEIGQLSKTFSGMTNNLKIIIQDIEYLLEEMSSGNFHVRTRAEELYAGIYRSILSAIHKNNRNLTKALIKINQASDQVSNSSYQVSNASQELAKGATQQAASVEELSATIAESAEHIKITAQNAEEARQLSKESSTYVLKCNQHMKDMMIAMDEITNTSNEIGKIIKTIDDIAFQTNILALNAAVEAARAGVAGKGFAVVAEEVRNLAQKSAGAAKNTTQLISSAILAIETGTKIADETALSLQTVVGKTSIVAQKIDNIADAASQQEESVYQITAGVDLISSVVQTNSATAEESAAASEELNGQAQILKDLVAGFTLSEDMTE